MWYFEDFKPGDVIDLGSVTVTESEMLDFARAFDPQRFHVDHDAAAGSTFGGLVASGWHTAAMFMRRYVDTVLADSSGEGSPGVDELRFVRPVRPGDTLTARLTVLGSFPSLSDSRLGIVKPRCEFVNSAGEVVFSMVLHSIFRRRD
ncbi:enoyl-CoA hydratase [Longispora fulva]|uniref:Acyl dehydratase n=1 Tax=Longispora fulva TaxID=619741 RepID=A0A8J7KF97_9ACTN|nr:MaoC family dehydratase [Longispora fulva]MBG6135915.1 acyl dehydratase [Longispora fulva]GIG55842.1 enoyl-CoA hydratase [Longispora fulva]